ncbi:MAG: hypothetical protein Q9170_004451 [Blastenia crenularia]
MSSEDHYGYEPLPSAPHSFRFARLQAGARNDPIQLVLEVHTLGTASGAPGMEYEALSWLSGGPYEDLRTVFVNGRSFEITPARELFRRSWVLQEGALARKLLLQCGADIVPWDSFYRAVSLRFSRDDRHARASASNEGWNAIQAIDNLRRVVASGQDPPDLLELIWACRNYRSTDPRDRIFALLGISNLLYGLDPKDQIGFEIDYTMPTADVFRSFTMSMLLHYNDLRVLGTRRLSRLYDDRGLGLWCPDWASLDDGVSLLYLRRQWSGNMVNYSTCRKSTPYEFRKSIISSNPPSLADGSMGKSWLCLQGYILDVIHDVRRTSHFDSDNARLYDWHHWALWPEERTWTETPQPSVEADPQRQDAFWRTIIADADANGNRHPIYLRTQFHVWYQRILEGFKDGSGGFVGNSDTDTYRDFLDRMRQVMKGRCLFETKEYGFLGIGDEDHSAELGGPQLRAGDLIAILDGGPLPVMLRKEPEQLEGRSLYRLIGDAFCYVHGASDGEDVSRQYLKMVPLLIV